MTWDARTWDAFCALLEEGWPGEFDDTARASWRVLLDATPPETAIGALRTLLLEGRRFRPSVSELLAATRRDPGRPTFEEAYRLIWGPRGVLRARPTSWGTAETANEAAMARAREFHPSIAAFIERQGLDRLRMLDVDSDDYAELRRKELREAWDRFCEAIDGREIAALALTRGTDGPHRFDPLAALDIGTAPALPAGEAT